MGREKEKYRSIVKELTYRTISFQILQFNFTWLTKQALYHIQNSKTKPFGAKNPSCLKRILRPL